MSDIVLFGEQSTGKCYKVRVHTDIPRPANWCDMSTTTPKSLKQKIGVRGILQACYMTHFHTYTNKNHVIESDNSHVRYIDTPQYFSLTSIDPYPNRCFKTPRFLESPFVCQSVDLTQKFLPIFDSILEGTSLEVSE